MVAVLLIHYFSVFSLEREFNMKNKRFFLILLTLGLAFIFLILLFALMPLSVSAITDPPMKEIEQQLYQPIAEIVEPTGDCCVTRAVEEKDGYAYLLTRDGILYTYNILDLKQQPSFVTYNTPVYTQTLPYGLGNGLLRYGDYIYAFGYHSLVILDVQNPSMPALIGSRYDPHFIFNMIRHGNYLIASGKDKIVVYTVDDPSNPTYLSELYIGQEQYIFSVAVYSNTLYTSHFLMDFNGTYTFTLSIVDFSNPSSLAILNNEDEDYGEAGYHLRVIDNQLVECGDYVVRLWSLTTPTNPTLLTQQSASARVCAQDGKNIITNGTVFQPNENGLQVISTFMPGAAAGDGFPYGSAVNSSYVFLAQNKRILILSAINPRLSINYSSGSPGSFFTITGQDFVPDSTVPISVNKNTLGNVSADSSGNIMFLLNTDLADEGHYVVTAVVNPSASSYFVLDSDLPIRPQEGSGTIFYVPSGIAYTNIVYLPIARK